MREMTIGWTKTMIRKRMMMMTMTKLGLGQVRRGETRLLSSQSYRSRPGNADDHVYPRYPDPNRPANLENLPKRRKHPHAHRIARQIEPLIRHQPDLHPDRHLRAGPSGRHGICNPCIIRKSIRSMRWTMSRPRQDRCLEGQSRIRARAMTTCVWDERRAGEESSGRVGVGAEAGCAQSRARSGMRMLIWT
jgi:hypothetical protein